MFDVQVLAIIIGPSGYISLLRRKRAPSLSWGADNRKYSAILPTGKTHKISVKSTGSTVQKTIPALQESFLFYQSLPMYYGLWPMSYELTS
jgi:hypothetical protein